MEDFGTIVYIVAAIGWVIWNTFQKAQQAKKKPATTPHHQDAGSKTVQEDHSGPKSLEELLSGQWGKSSPAERWHDKKVKSVSSEMMPQSRLPTDYAMSESEINRPRVKSKRPKLAVIDLEEENHIGELMPQGFDLRQAVVLNAILERPYN